MEIKEMPELVDDYQNLKKLNWFEEKFLDLKILFVWKIWKTIHRAKYEPMYAWQRARRGYSDRDLWAFDHHLHEMLSTALLWYARNRAGSPCQAEMSEEDPTSTKCAMSWKPDAPKCLCHENWTKMLLENAEKFRLLALDDFEDDEKEKWWEKEDRIRKEAWEWLKEWNGALWD